MCFQLQNNNPIVKISNPQLGLDGIDVNGQVLGVEDI
jgi:hypothetical protein